MAVERLAGRQITAWLREIRPFLIALALVAVGETAIAQPFIVPSGSMEPSLLVGDEIVASKFAYGYSKFSAPVGTLPLPDGRLLFRPPQRGDVVVFALPRDPSEIYVKRLIGLPGDRIQMRQGQLYINGQEIPRRADGRFTTEGRSYARYVETLPGGRAHEILKLGDDGPENNTPVFVVPARCYFMMGDNRDDSLDSRVPPGQGGVGFVPEENLVGRADRVLFSITPFPGWSDVAERPWALRISRILDAIR